MNVSQLVIKLGTLNEEANEIYKKYKEVKEEVDKIRQGLTTALTENGLRSAKTEHYIASMSTRKDIQIVNELDAIAWVEEKGLDTEHLIGLKTTNFKTLAKSMLKDTGEIAPGAEVVEIESLSIRANK